MKLLRPLVLLALATVAPFAARAAEDAAPGLALGQPAPLRDLRMPGVDGRAVAIADVAGKRIGMKYVDGPVGVQSRNFANDRIYSTGWRSRFPLREGLALTYPWVQAQVLAEWRKSATSLVR